MARRRPDDNPDDGGDYSIPLGPTSPVVAPTMEIDTSELKDMATSGEAAAKPNRVVQTSDGRLVELEQGWNQETGGASVIIADELAPQAVHTQPAARRSEPPAARGTWIVVVVYLLATTALGLAIYERFFT